MGQPWGLANVNAVAMLNLSKSFLAKNNPLMGFLNEVVQFCYYWSTFHKKLKLVRYKFLLARQQLMNMEAHINHNPYEIKGNKLDRIY